MTKALVLRQAEPTAQAWQKRFGYTLVVSPSWDLPGDKTLFVASKCAPPWRLLEAGFGLLDRWDVAAPLWRYGLLAKDIGGPSERERTAKVIRDLRQLLYAHEILFVKASPDGRRFLETWLAECQGTTDPRLAFLRALHLVKPLFCALPRSWLADEAQRAQQDAKSSVPTPSLPPEIRMPHSRPALGGLVKVEIGPGRFVTCRPGEEAQVKAVFKEQAMRRGDRRRLVNAH